MSYTKTTFSSSTNVTGEDPAKRLRLFIDWVNSELLKIEETSARPIVQGLSFEPLYADPVKYQEGDLYYFADGRPGAPGLFIRDSASWRKL